MIRVALAMLLAATAAMPAEARTSQLRVGHLIDPGSGAVTHDRLLTFVDGKIARDEAWRGARREGDLIDWSGKWVLPGGIDSHVHISQPSGEGIVMADDFESGTRSAACGG